MISSRAILLASTALFAAAAFAPPAISASADRTILLAQAAPPPAEADDAQRNRPQRGDRPGADVKKPEPPKAAAPAQPPAAPAQPPAAQAQPPKPPAPAAQAPQPPKLSAPAAQAPQQAAPPPRAERDRPAQPRPAEDRAQRRDDRRDGKPPAAAAQDKPATPPAPAAQQQRPAAPPPPAAAQQQRPGTPPAPAAAQQRPPAPAAQGSTTPPPPATAQPQPSATPAAPPPAAAAPAPAAPAVAGTPAPAQPRNANEFIRRDGQAATRGMDDIRKERREVREGNRTVIREGDRTIVRDGNRTIIRHTESDRFSVGARDVRVDRRGNETVNLVVRPNGITIISTVDRDGHLIRRVRRDSAGREIVLIDNGFAGARRADWFIELPPPVIRMPRERYIVDGGRASSAEIYAVFTAPPVQAIERRYTLDQVRYSAPLRDRMPRVDLDINFETGSWQLTPDQVERLAEVAQALKRAIEANPKEVFLVEGHTDAVGSDEDNLSLSDRRAESVAVALTEQFQVPPENLVTQGYGEQYLKVATEGAERANRRVSARRITPLMAQAQTEGGGTRR